MRVAEFAGDGRHQSAHRRREGGQPQPAGHGAGLRGAARTRATPGRPAGATPSSTSCRPWSVSITPRPTRSSSGTPACLSSRLTCWDTALGVKPRASAARDHRTVGVDGAEAVRAARSIMKQCYLIGCMNHSLVLHGQSTDDWDREPPRLAPRRPRRRPVGLQLRRHRLGHGRTCRRCSSPRSGSRRRPSRRSSSSAPEAPWRVVRRSGVFMSLGQFGLLYTRMAAGMPPGLAALVLQAQVVLTIVIAAGVLRERADPPQVVGVAARRRRTGRRRRSAAAATCPLARARAVPARRAVVGDRQRRLPGGQGARRPLADGLVGPGRAAPAAGALAGSRRSGGGRRRAGRLLAGRRWCPRSTPRGSRPSSATGSSTGCSRAGRRAWCRGSCWPRSCDRLRVAAVLGQRPNAAEPAVACCCSSGSWWRCARPSAYTCALRVGPSEVPVR